MKGGRDRGRKKERKKEIEEKGKKEGNRGKDIQQAIVIGYLSNSINVCNVINIPSCKYCERGLWK